MERGDISIQSLSKKPAKRASEVSCVGATAIQIYEDKVGFLGSNGIIYLLDRSKNRSLDSSRLKEGKVFWVYYAVENSSVVSVVEFNGEKIEDMPKLEAVEVSYL